MDAAVDVGTNTVRLLFATMCGGRLKPNHYFRRITRLGGGSTAGGELIPEAMARTLDALEEAAQLIRQADIRRLRVVGTEALRRAGNRAYFVRQVFERTGLSLEVIGGEEEARLSATGVLAALEPVPRRCLVFDIGGGSTEFVLCDDSVPVFHRSYPLGVVSLAESHLAPEATSACIGEMLGVLGDDLSVAGLLEIVTSPACPLVGTAGTVTTLAAMKLGMTDYDWRLVNNLPITMAELKNLESSLAPLAPAVRETLPGIEKGRGDLILPGVHIVLALMERLGQERMTVSDFGLLEGVIMDLATPPPVRAGCN